MLPLISLVLIFLNLSPSHFLISFRLSKTEKTKETGKLKMKTNDFLLKIHGKKIENKKNTCYG